MSLAVHLEHAAVAGRIVTPVHDVHRKARRLEEGDPRVTLGLGHLLPATADEVIGALGKLTGRPFPPESEGDERSWVSPEGLVAQAEASAERLRMACERRERVLFGTGHPAGPLELYVRLADAMRARGAQIERFAEAEAFEVDAGRGQVRYVCDVACFSSGGELLHTHSPAPMEYLLGVGRVPDLVVGDHGFAGAGLARGADAVALVDTNDPGLILAWVRGLAIWPMLCDDNRPPSAYAPLAEHMIDRLDG